MFGLLTGPVLQVQQRHRAADRYTGLDLGLEPTEDRDVTLRIEAISSIAAARRQHAVAPLPGAQCRRGDTGLLDDGLDGVDRRVCGATEMIGFCHRWDFPPRSRSSGKLVGDTLRRCHELGRLVEHRHPCLIRGHR